MGDENQRNFTESRDARLDRGFHALGQGNWELADGIFDRLLEEDPHCGMSCLGKAMAAQQIHGREELAENWDRLNRNPDFERMLSPAKADFLPWLRKDMAAANEEYRNRSGTPFMDFSDLAICLPDFSNLSMGRKILLIFAGVQVALCLLTASFLGKTDPETDNFFGNLLVAAIFTGLPVILGPLYGNSILEAGRFCRLLRILNNIVAVLGSGSYAILAIAGYLFIQEGSGVTFSDPYFCYVFITAFSAHFLSLVVPPVLNRVEYGS